MLVLLAGSLGALLVFGLGLLRDHVRLRRERQGLMILLHIELLQNRSITKRWEQTPHFIHSGGIEDYTMDVWTGIRVRLAQLLQMDEFTKLVAHYVAIQGVKDNVLNWKRTDNPNLASEGYRRTLTETSELATSKTDPYLDAAHHTRRQRIISGVSSRVPQRLRNVLRRKTSSNGSEQ